MKAKKYGWALAVACVLSLGMPALAQSNTQVTRTEDQNMDDDRTVTTEEGDININSAPVAAAPAEGTMSAKPPRSYPSLIRLIPTGGVASFTTANKVDLENFDEGFSAGLLVDIGSNAWVFETGVLALNADTQTDAGTNTGSLTVDSWGIPLFGKINLSGNPYSTVFLKAGVMPFQPSGASDEFDVLGVAGVGGAIPLFRNTALTLEASYNRILDDGGELGTYQGVAALAGLQIGL